MPPKRRALTPLERHEICKRRLEPRNAGKRECFFFAATGKGGALFLFLSASSSGIANIIYMVAGIIYFEKLVRSGRVPGC